MFSSDTICYFNAGSSDTAELLGNYLSKILIKNGFSDIAPVLLCIGSDRVTGDSLGPMVGSALEERYKKSIPVFGTLKMPVHMVTLLLRRKRKLRDEETIDAIHLHFPDHPLIAVDASFGTKEHLGCITAGKGSLCPGAGVDKNLIAVGDFFVTGIVASFSPFSHLVLQSTRLSAVMPLASQISRGIAHAIDEIAPTKSEYFRWYQLAVEADIRITRLYEYYIETMPQGFQSVLPQVIRMYFVYNNTLSSRKRASVYANVIRNKEADKTTYQNYRKAMEAFAQEALMEGRISEDYATIYQEYIEDIATPALGEAMAKVMFSYRVYCDDPKIRSVIVCHGELKEEQSHNL